MQKIKILVLGEFGVGKTQLIKSFVNEKFQDQYYPTFNEEYKIDYELDKINYQLSILDVHGIDKIDSRLKDLITSSHGFFFVYALTRINSFSKIIEIKKNVLQIKKRPALILGNKYDMVKDREVQSTIILKQSQIVDSPNFYVCAKNGENVKESFDQLIRLIVKDRKLKRVKKKDQFCCFQFNYNEILNC